MFLRALKRKQKYIMSLLISYFLILLIPLLVGLLAYNEAFKVVKEDVMEYNLAVLEQTMNIIDSRMKEINNMIFRLILDPKIKYFLYIDKPFENSTYFILWEMLKYLNPNTLTNDFIVDFGIYFHRNDTVVSSGSVNTLQSFYNNFFKKDVLDFSEWKNIILEKNYNGIFLSSPPAVIDGKEHEVISYIRSMPIGYPGQFDGAIIVLIDKKRINELLSRAITGDDGYIYIADKNNHVLTGLSKKNMFVNPVEIESLNHVPVKDTFEKYINGKWMTISCITSSYNGWNYVAALPSIIVMEKVDYIKKFTLSITAFSLILGILTACFMAYRNTKPLKNIIKILKEFFENDTRQSIDNEYSFLEDTIAELIENNQYLQQILQKQIPVLKSVFFNAFLNGKFNSVDEIKLLLSNMDLAIEGNKFVVLLVYIKGYKELTNENDLKEFDGIRVIVKDLLENCLVGKGYCHFADMDKIAVLISGKYDNDKDFIAYVEEIVKMTYQKIKVQYNVKLSFFAGNIYNGLQQVYYSFDEAKLAMDYQSTREENNNIVLWYHQIPKRKQQYNYSVEMETRLMNLIKSGNKQEMGNLLQSVYYENTINRTLTSDMKMQLMFEMRGTTIKLAEQLGLYEHFQEDILSIDYSEDIDKFYKHIVKICSGLCDMVNERKYSNSSNLKKKIIEYIYESYSDSNLCLSSIALEFNITEEYLSMFFKKQTGENISNFLEKVRIEKACQLLQNENLSINNISIKVGYNSDKVFRRAFKRVKGLSPTSFRRLFNEETNNCM